MLDTHILLWGLSEPEKIPQTFRRELDSLTNTCFVSSVSIAEIMIKVSIGKLVIPFDPLMEAEEAGFEMIPFTGEDAGPLRDLPFHHRDPFDRMLIAQGLTRELPIMTCDRKFGMYDCKLVL